ncbi:YdbC family protein [Pontibacillus salicampi]|uniref:YdbC family protein n=1 Tax=Pontibacillus salicampi TaxID=1449801 RepID=A0ABV6LLW1_9BACI
MLIKWIVCTVPERNKEDFAQAQSQWKKLRYIDGFIGQIGGWSSQDKSQAGILTFWKDRDSYQFFMEHVHDKIFNQSGQGDTYDNITIEILENNWDISDFYLTNELQHTTYLHILQGEVIQGDKLGNYQAWGGLIPAENNSMGIVISFDKDERLKENYLTEALQNRDELIFPINQEWKVV